MGDSQGSRILLTSLVRQYVAPLLSAHDFRRSKFVWNRRRTGIIQVLDLQTGRWSTEKELSFTVNLGVLVERVWQILWDNHVPKTIQESDCFPRLRISYLLQEGPVREDVWWSLKSSKDVAVMGGKLEGLLSEKCIPFLDKLDSINTIAALSEDPVLRRTPPEQLPYAVLKYLTGARDDAQQILSSLLENKRLIVWHDRVREVRARLVNLV